MDPNELLEVQRRRRSIRRFTQEKIPQDVLERIVKAGTYTPFSCNANYAVDYILVMENLDQVFPHVRFAHYADDAQPTKDEQPTAYILPLLNVEIVNELVNSFPPKKRTQAQESFGHSYGMVLQAMVMQATVEGIGTCPIAGVNGDEVKENFGIDREYEIRTILALGYAAEKPEVRMVNRGESTRYFVEDGRLIVPKVEPIVQWK